MEEKRAKQVITDLLLLQREFLMAGGISATTNKSYRYFVQKRKFLLKVYGLETDPNTLHILHDHPFSFNLNILECTVDICPFAAKRIIGNALLGIGMCQISLKNYGAAYWGINARVEYMYNNLELLWTTGLPEMD